MTRVSGDWLTQPETRKVCALLTDAGYQAWFVGGCVRNALIGAPVHDLDLTTLVPDPHDASSRHHLRRRHAEVLVLHAV